MTTKPPTMAEDVKHNLLTAARISRSLRSDTPRGYRGETSALAAITRVADVVSRLDEEAARTLTHHERAAVDLLATYFLRRETGKALRAVCLDLDGSWSPLYPQALLDAGESGMRGQRAFADARELSELHKLLYERLPSALMFAHLSGILQVGAYSLVWATPGITPDGIAAYGCVDFDDGLEESLIHARNVQTLLRAAGMEALVERSRSKGAHVWVFPPLNEIWPLPLVREALLEAATLVGAPTREVNPKNKVRFDEQGQLRVVGNFVRVPGWGLLLDPTAEGQRFLDVEPTVASYATAVSSAAWGQEVNKRVLLKLQERWHEREKAKAALRPPAPDRGSLARPKQISPELIERMSSLARKIWEEGPLEGADRSSTLWRLAKALTPRHHSRLAFGEALALLMDADERWGKFTARGDEEILVGMLDKAWEV